MHAAVFLQMQTNGLLYLLPTPTHTNLPMAHLRGLHPMTASEPPTKWDADIRGDDDVHVVCRVEEGRAAAARMRRRENQ